MQNAKCKMQNAKYKIQNTKCKIGERRDCLPPGGRWILRSKRRREPSGSRIISLLKYGLGLHPSLSKTPFQPNGNHITRMLPPPRIARHLCPSALMVAVRRNRRLLLPLPCGVTRHSKTIINCFETAYPRREAFVPPPHLPNRDENANRAS